MTNIKYIVFLFCIPLFIFSQKKEKKENKKDSIKTYKLDEVVIRTAQHSPQSVKKAVYDVSVIKNNKITNLAANTLEDVLQQSLNLQVIPNRSTGRNTISLFGLDGQYVKILVDNIPLVNDEGFGNNADLSQINLQDVEQIEIVEGAMAVEYGANAVAGVVNIVTKKKSAKKINVNASVLEETVGKEFKLFEQGKHIQTLGIMYNITDELFGSFSVNRNDFRGFFKHRKGQYYHGEEGLRGHHWYPREQYNTNMLLNYKSNGWKTFYKVSYMNDKIDNYNKTFTKNYNPTTNTSKPYAFDKQYNTVRMYHNLNVDKELSEWSNFNVNFSLQTQKRDEKSYTFYLKTHKIENEKEKIASEMKIFTSVGSYNFENKNRKFKTRLGYDIGIKTILMSNLAISDGKDVQERNLNHYDFYGFTEYAVRPNLSLRIGSRGMFSDLFDTKVAYSLSSKYILNDWQLRFVFGSSPRNPNFEELYFNFVDTNHNLQGNENVKAENAISFNLNIKKNYTLFDTKNRLKLKTQFIDVIDRITWVWQEKEGRDVYTTINIDKYTAWSVSLTDELHYKNFRFNFGVMSLGTKQTSKNIKMGNKFLYNYQLNSGITYKVPKYGLSFSSYYKYNGKEQRFIMGSNNELEISEQSPYNWLDCSINKSFFHQKLVLTIGVRNLTNTTQISSFTQDAGAHSEPTSTREFSYGRSYFSKLTFKF